jgi:uncharacterized delta-60 repeat protein
LDVAAERPIHQAPAIGTGSELVAMLRRARLSCWRAIRAAFLLGRFGRPRGVASNVRRICAVVALKALVASAAAASLAAGAAGAGAPGDIDRSFGRSGIVRTDVADQGRDRCFEILFQPDRKVVCIGQTIPRGSQHEDAVLARYLSNGRLDATFGARGVARFGSPDLDEVPLSGVRQPDGKIAVAGVADVRGGGQDLFVARLGPDGALDKAFGSGGTVTTDVGAGDDFDFGYGVALQRDGKIVVVGDTGVRDRPGDIAVARYTREGALDPSFGVDGKLQTDLGGAETAHAVAVQRDGKIVVGGAHGPGGEAGIVGFLLVRYRPNGGLDPTFGRGGVVRTRHPGLDAGSVTTLMLLPDGRIVAAGYGIAGDEYLLVVRYTATGAIDRSFGRNGNVAIRVAPAVSEIGGFAGAIQADGKILVAGGSGGRFFVARLLPDGKLDRSFGGIGFVATQPASRGAGWASAVAVNRTDIVAAGTWHARRLLEGEDFGLVRYLARGRVGTRIESASVRGGRRGAIIRWQTISELGSSRFEVHRELNGRRVALRPALAARGTRRRGASYAVRDPSARRDELGPFYWLIEIKRSGRRIDYGPLPWGFDRLPGR